MQCVRWLAWSGTQDSRAIWSPLNRQDDSSEADNLVIEPFCIGDPAYPLSKYLIQLSRQQCHTGKRTFQPWNKPHGNPDEESIWTAERKIRCLLKPLNCILNKVVLCVTSACILRNL